MEGLTPPAWYALGQAHQSIGVQEQEIVSFAYLKALVIGCGEAQVLLIAQELNLGKPLSHHLHRPIPRGVIDHDDLVSEGRGGKVREQ